MMNIFRILILLFIAPLANAGGDYFQVYVNDFRETSTNEYQIDFIQLSQPYGKEHVVDENLIVNLRYNCSVIFCSRYAPTIDQYHEAIRLLKSQAIKGTKINFGVISGGYEHMSDNMYQSNALEVYQGVVYSYESIK